MTRYLVTGGAGFIGSHLAESLLDKGHVVTVIDNLSTGRFENIEHLVENPHFHYAIDTINNVVVLDRLASDCDVVFHLAAAVGVKQIVNNPILTLETNMGGTEAVLKAAVRYRAKVVLSSTSEVYGKREQVPFHEDDDIHLGPTIRNRWAYAGSKMMDEFLALAYYAKKDLPVVVPRLFNTIGPRQRGMYGMVVPRFVRQALEGEPITVFGDGQQRRSFTWVGDCVRAIMDLSQKPEAVGEVINVGHQKDISIYELALLVKELTGSGSSIVFIPYQEVYNGGFEDMRARLPDLSKIKGLINYQPSLDLPQMLERIIADVKS
jgi:UDP-glucose 4-epimerase